MYEDERSSQSLHHSDMMVVGLECPNNLSKKRKLEADLLVLPRSKHFCVEQLVPLPDSSCPSSAVDSAGCSYVTEDAKISDETTSSASVSGASHGSTISNNTDQYCSKVNNETQEYIEDLSDMDFICPELTVTDLPEVSNPVGSYILSSARWTGNNNNNQGNQQPKLKDLDSTLISVYSLPLDRADPEEPPPKPTIDQEFEEYFSALMM